MATATLVALRDDIRSTLTEVQGGMDDETLLALSRRIAVETLAELGQIPEAKRRLDEDLLRQGVVYAVPDAELKLIPSFVKAGLAVFTKGPLAGVPELVALFVRYQQLKVELTAGEAAIIRVLRDARKNGDGALAAADILDRLERWGATVEDVPAQLKRLKAKNRDKTVLVSETEGRWSVGNVT